MIVTMRVTMMETMMLTMMLMIITTTWTLANEDLRNNSVHRSQRRHTVGRTSCQRVERWQEKKKRNKRLTRNTQSQYTFLWQIFFVKTYMFYSLSMFLFVCFVYLLFCNFIHPAAHCNVVQGSRCKKGNKLRRQATF